MWWGTKAILVLVPALALAIGSGIDKVLGAALGEALRTPVEGTAAGSQGQTEPRGTAQPEAPGARARASAALLGASEKENTGPSFRRCKSFKIKTTGA